MRACCGSASRNELAFGKHLVEVEMEIWEGRDVDLHEFAHARRTADRPWEGVALPDVLLIDQLGEALRIVGVPASVHSVARP